MPNSATIVHAKVSTKPAVADSSIIGGPDWNAGHVLTGLDQVDNTSDANKPVSTAQATANALVASNAAAATALKSNIASPTFTGTPAAPTATALTNTTQLATTAYADSATAVEKTRALAAEALLAPLASPALTGTPTAPTATVGTNTTQLATTAFVLANLGFGTGATLQTNLSDPHNTTSASAVMMGLGGVATLTPVSSSRVKIEFMGRFNLSASGSGSIGVRFGTGTAPTNTLGTTAATGTAVGQGITSISFNAASNVPFNVGGIITSLTPGTAYWFDLTLTANSITTSVVGCSFNAMEF